MIWQNSAVAAHDLIRRPIAITRTEFGAERDSEKSVADSAIDFEVLSARGASYNSIRQQHADHRDLHGNPADLCRGRKRMDRL